MEFARKYKKPRLHLHPGISEVADKLRALVQEKSVKVLNVAGPRASKEPEVVRFVMALLDEVLGMPD
jgi:Circularly permutated YpsA SLOG family